MTNDVKTIEAPEQGQIVAVRQRRFVVTEVLASTLPSSPLAGREAAQHLITLTSIEDDALGEGLQVVWELEPGVQVSEKVELPAPAGFDPPERLDSFLDAVRWGAVASADVRALQAPFRSGIEMEDYQLDPLVRAVQMPRVNLLIADDVGLGKTIEAGLVIQELIVRNRARTVLVVCPAGLQIHWRDQMRDKFGLEFRIVDSDLMRQLRRSRGIHVNPWSHFPRLITSIDFVKRDRPLRLFREVLPPEGQVTYPRPFDVLVVDEAHNVAPSGSGRYAVDSLRTQAVRTIAPHFEHKLFLTATPHNGYQESFSALLELLDNQRFARGVLPNRRQLEAVMVRRLKTELKDWDGTPRFPQRQLHAIEVEYSAEEKQVHAWLREYTTLRQAHAGDEAERFATEFVMKLLKKRLFSSPAAFAATLDRHMRTLAGEGAEKRAARPTMGILRRQIAQIDEEYADDEEYEEAASGAVDTSSRTFDTLSARERWLLDKMRAWAAKARAQRDCKTEAFFPLRWVRRRQPWPVVAHRKRESHLRGGAMPKSLGCWWLWESSCTSPPVPWGAGWQPRRSGLGAFTTGSTSWTHRPFWNVPVRFWSCTTMPKSGWHRGSGLSVPMRKHRSRLEKDQSHQSQRYQSTRSISLTAIRAREP